MVLFNPNKGRGEGEGLNQDICWEIGCHFLQEPPRYLKILEFFKNDVRPRGRPFPYPKVYPTNLTGNISPVT